MKLSWSILLLSTGISLSAGDIFGVPQPIAAEKTALQELKQAIRQVTGQTNPATLPDIKLLYDVKLGPEAWKIERRNGGEVTIRGGRPRGVLYGVYEFVERALGVTFCALDYTDYPRQNKLTLPQVFLWQGQPAFGYRNIYYPPTHFPRQKYVQFHARMRMCGPLLTARYGFSENPGSPSNAHTYLTYTRNFPVEISWMNRYGKRIQVKTTYDGQLCYTNPEVRRRVAEKLRQYIARDRKNAAKWGRPAPTVYHLSANDCDAKCFCPKCRQFAQQHNVSGLVLDFTNAVARDVARDYPEIKLMCFAYKDALLPPRGVKAASNVIVQIAAMDLEFNNPAIHRDVLRPISTPENAPYRDILAQWHQTGARLAIWDYWKLYYDAFPSPKGYITNRADYLKSYQKYQVEWIFIEAEIDTIKEMESFNDLRLYIGAKLMVNPELDMSSALKKYLTAFYGAAAPAMTEYLQYIEKCMAQTPGHLSGFHVSKRKYLNREFLDRCDALLGQAAQAVRGDAARSRHVAQEQFIVDMARANLFPPASAALKQRIAHGFKIWGSRYIAADYWQKHGTQQLNNLLAKLSRPALPAELAAVPGLKELCWPDFHPKLLGKDAEATGGNCLALCGSLALRNSSLKDRPRELHTKRPPQFGIYSAQTKRYLLTRRLDWAQLPQDEKFHWYRLGTSKLDPSTRFWGHWTWYLVASLNKIYDRAMPDRRYDFYVSLKLQGPYYVKSSSQANDFKVDRIIAVPHGTQLSTALKIY